MKSTGQMSNIFYNECAEICPKQSPGTTKGLGRKVMAARPHQTNHFVAMVDEFFM